MKKLIYEVWLNNIKGIGPCLIHSLLDQLETYENIYNASKPMLLAANKVGTKTADLILAHKDLSPAISIIEHCERCNITIITSNDASYPRRLLLYKEAPLLLYVRGDLAPFNHLASSAIVGSRRCDHYGKKATNELVTALATQNKCVISGMAKGIDAYAHTYALKNNMYTIAVLGTGVDRCYPSEHATLMDAIIEHGALVSQFPHNTTIHKQNFLRRNKLIAMLCDELYVMQATLNSGALYTANCATDYNKRVYSLPGSIYDELSMGCNLLIQQGALIYSKAPCYINTASKDVSSEYRNVIQLLSERPLSIDELCHALQCNSTSIAEIIFNLEMQDQVVQFGDMVRLNGV